MYKRPCFDSSVFLGGFNNEVRNHVKRGVVFQSLIERARLGDFKIFIAAAAIAEVYKTQSWGTSDQDRLDELFCLLDEDLITPIELDRSVAVEAHSLCRKHSSLRPFDAIHLACAASAGCDYLLTWDKRFEAVVHEKVKVEHPAMQAGTLFEASAVATEQEQHAWYVSNPKRLSRKEIVHVQSTFDSSGGI